MGRRIEKFKKKLDGAVRGKLFDAQKEQMVANETQPTKDLVEIELQVKEICDGEPTIFLPYYIIFGKEIYSKANKHKGKAFYNEVMILEDKWEARGLNPHLCEIIKNIWGIPIPGELIFRLDISELDGPDLLS